MALLYAKSPSPPNDALNDSASPGAGAVTMEVQQDPQFDDICARVDGHSDKHEALVAMLVAELEVISKDCGHYRRQLAQAQRAKEDAESNSLAARADALRIKEHASKVEAENIRLQAELELLRGKEAATDKELASLRQLLQSTMDENGKNRRLLQQRLHHEVQAQHKPQPPTAFESLLSESALAQRPSVLADGGSGLQGASGTSRHMSPVRPYHQAEATQPPSATMRLTEKAPELTSEVMRSPIPQVDVLEGSRAASPAPISPDCPPQPQLAAVAPATAAIPSSYMHLVDTPNSTNRALPVVSPAITTRQSTPLGQQQQQQPPPRMIMSPTSTTSITNMVASRHTDATVNAASPPPAPSLMQLRRSLLQHQPPTQQGPSTMPAQPSPTRAVIPANPEVSTGVTLSNEGSVCISTGALPQGLCFYSSAATAGDLSFEAHARSGDPTNVVVGLTAYTSTTDGEAVAKERLSVRCDGSVSIVSGPVGSAETQYVPTRTLPLSVVMQPNRPFIVAIRYVAASREVTIAINDTLLTLQPLVVPDSFSLYHLCPFALLPGRGDEMVMRHP